MSPLALACVSSTVQLAGNEVPIMTEYVNASDAREIVIRLIPLIVPKYHS